MTATAQQRPPDLLTVPANLNFMALLAGDTLGRVGGSHDGGDVIPRPLVDKTEVLVSMGVSENWTLDEQFRRLCPGLRIHAYDRTISRLVFIRRVAVGIARMLLGAVPASGVARRVRLLNHYEAFFTGHANHFREIIDAILRRGEAQRRTLPVPSVDAPNDPHRSDYAPAFDLP